MWFGEGIQHYSFACGYSVVSVSFVEKIILPSSELSWHSEWSLWNKSSPLSLHPTPFISNHHARSLGGGSPSEQHDPGSRVWKSALWQLSGSMLETHSPPQAYFPQRCRKRALPQLSWTVVNTEDTAAKSRRHYGQAASHFQAEALESFY